MPSPPPVPSPPQTRTLPTFLIWQVEHVYLGFNPLGRPSPDGIDALKQAAAGRDTLQVHFS